MCAVVENYVDEVIMQSHKQCNINNEKCTDGQILIEEVDIAKTSSGKELSQFPSDHLRMACPLCFGGTTITDDGLM